MKFVPAIAYHFYLAMPAAFTQPGAHLLAQPCYSYTYLASFMRSPLFIKCTVSLQSCRSDAWRGSSSRTAWRPSPTSTSAGGERPRCELWMMRLIEWGSEKGNMCTIPTVETATYVKKAWEAAQVFFQTDKESCLRYTQARCWVEEE